MVPVIICGGFGTKLWPISREEKPKHLLPLFDNKSLIEINYESLRTHFSPEQIFISTNEYQSNLIRDLIKEIPEENYIIEPQMRNQGPATGLIAAFLMKKGLQDEPFMIVQGDVLREPSEDFIKMMLDCDKIARKEDKYITGGIKTDFPLMGVDYLIKGDKVSQEGSVGIFKVDSFVWRSNEAETAELIKQKGALIHANHTCMTPSNFFKMLQKYRIDWFDPLMEYVEGANIEEIYQKMPPGPIEDITQDVYANGEALVVELPFKWRDVGTFAALHECLKEKGLYHVGENVLDMDGHNNFVKVNQDNKSVVIIGLDNIVVVDTGDTLLLCDKNQTSRVNEALKVVKEKGMA